MKIQVDRLSHRYPGQQQDAVRDVSFSISKGEIFGFLGPSGAGKSTVQNILTGLLAVQKGTVLYSGKSIREMGREFFNQIGVSFEHPNVYTKLTGYENLKYFAGLFDGQTEDPLKLLDMVGLRESAHKKAGEYSKGMKNRLVFARSLINRAQILFFDEPLSGLDPATASKIKEIIIQKKQEGCTIFLTTHNMFVADELCDKVAFINEGQMITMDSPKTLKLEYGQQAVKVEWIEGNTVRSDTYFLHNAQSWSEFKRLVDSQTIQTMHTQEATLEEIFIKLTGRGLK